MSHPSRFWLQAAISAVALLVMAVGSVGADGHLFRVVNGELVPLDPSEPHSGYFVPTKSGLLIEMESPTASLEDIAEAVGGWDQLAIAQGPSISSIGFPSGWSLLADLNGQEWANDARSPAGSPWLRSIPATLDHAVRGNPGDPLPLTADDLISGGVSPRFFRVQSGQLSPMDPSERHELDFHAGRFMLTTSGDLINYNTGLAPNEQIEAIASAVGGIDNLVTTYGDGSFSWDFRPGPEAFSPELTGDDTAGADQPAPSLPGVELTSWSALKTEFMQ
jgi:hypothetical protein